MRSHLTPARWQKAKAVVADAAELASPAARAAFVAEQCGDDEQLRLEVESLLNTPTDGFDDLAKVVSAPRGQLEAGRRIGDYAVMRELGRGGMGAVYLAHRADGEFDKQVALKLLKRGTDTDEILARFRAERRILARLDHPNIARLLDAGSTEDGLPYFVMEYVEGAPITQYAREHSLSVADRLSLFRLACAAVSYAHRNSVIHRDLKPANILVTSEKEVKLLDFGIAKLVQETGDNPHAPTLTMHRVMTPEYASPEQLTGEMITTASDVYSLGIVLYELLTGRRPYHFKTRAPEELARAITQDEPERPSTAVVKDDSPSSTTAADRKHLRGDLDNIVLKALRNQPSQRYPTVADLNEDIGRHLERKPVHARPRTAGYVTRRFFARHKAQFSVAIALCVIGTLLGVIASLRNNSIDLTAIPAKSVAVLPFQNLSEEKESSLIVNGLQADILAQLDRVADLKVISRASVADYKPEQARNLPEIARALHVAHILQGSVRATRGKIRVVTQLVDALSGAQVWAETYDRNLADVFTIQSEIARNIADQLQAKLSPKEKALMAKPPTVDPTAYELYLRARDLIENAHVNQARTVVPQGIELLQQALARDPDFLLAHSSLALAHDTLYWFELDRTPERLALAEAEVRAAERLQPEAGETHRARGQHLYWGYRDYEGARAEFSIASRALPNDASTLALIAFIDRRLGRWNDSVLEMEKALEVDPRNIATLRQAALSYQKLRDYRKVTTTCERILAIDPNDAHFRAAKAAVSFDRAGENRELDAILPVLLTWDLREAPQVSSLAIDFALCEHNDALATAGLKAIPENGFIDRAGVTYPRGWFEGLVARSDGDLAHAKEAFLRARAETARRVEGATDNAKALSVLGLLDAMLGRETEALEEGRRAVKLLPVSKDAFDGPEMIANLALTCALVGEKNLALEYLTSAASLPTYNLTYGRLKYYPLWANLRGDERFEKILAKAAP